MSAYNAPAPGDPPWTPPQELLDLLPRLPKVVDKVEVIIAFYAKEHRGNSPTLQEIADVLMIKKANVGRRVSQLIAAGRAKRLHGKLFLVGGIYTHPALLAA